MSSPLFSTYSQGENRVTSTILAVFERLSFTIVEQILQSIIEDSSIDLVSFKNQPKADDSIPDAQISASFSYWIETKVVPDSLEIGQIKKHLKLLEKGDFKDQHLIVLTPDSKEPTILDNLSPLEKDKTTWANFDGLINAITGSITVEEDWLASDKPIPTESERELLRELVHFLTTEGLLDRSENRILVLPAKRAYGEYLNSGLYLCQPNRSFQPSSRLGFYCDGEIKPIFPKILNSIESVRFEKDAISDNSDLTDDEKSELLNAIENLSEDKIKRIGDDAKVMFLSSPDSSDTLNIKNAIKNNLKSSTGKNTAFTQNQRYITTDAVKENPKSTKELLDLMNS